MDWVTIAWLIFRASYSWVFLNAAWQCGKNRAGVDWTIAESEIIFGRFAPVLGPIGIVVMAVGGLSILFGIFAEIGGVLLASFLVPGTVIHLRKRSEARGLADALRSELGSSHLESLDKLTVLAVLGHYSSAMKNVSLIGPAVYFAVMGCGPMGFYRWWGLAGGG